MGSASYWEAAAQLTRGQLLDLLLEIEDRLKLLIRSVFRRHRGDDWLSLIPKGIREELDVQPSSAASKMGSSADLLDRATLKQLIGVVLAQWKLFQPILDDKTWLQAKLEELREARNALAHGLQPSPDDKVKIALTAAEIGRRIPVPPQPHEPKQGPAGRALSGRAILWVDDHPESNAWARRLLTGFGAEVVPVLSNEEAVEEAKLRSFDVAVSDIDRGAGEPGTHLGVRLHAAGIDIPIIFFIARLDPRLPPPVGAIHVSNDMVAMLTCLLSLLRPGDVAKR